MPSFGSRLSGSSTVGVGICVDGGEIGSRVVPSITKAPPLLVEDPLPLVTTSERATDWIAGREPLSWNPLLDGASFRKGYPVSVRSVTI